MADVAILGAGVMGSAMTLPAAASGRSIDLVGTHLDGDIIRSVAGNGLHPRLGVTMPGSVVAHEWTAFGEVMAARPSVLILGVSSAGVDWAIERVVAAVTAPLPILMITKGLVPRDGTIEVLPRYVAREIERRTGMAMPVLAVGGPCIAGELAAGRDTSVVVTGADPAQVESVLSMFEAPFYHARASADVVGVEVCAAFKNFFALGVGAAAGLLEQAGKAGNGALMHNLAAALFTEALAEMTVLVEALGGQAETVAGLAGAGDLYVTCQAGRNSRMGRLLGLGLSYSRAKADHMPADTVEGAQLAQDLGPTLDAMIAKGTLPGDRLPLARAIVGAVCREEALTPELALFHRPG
jgi:glycerol-3-phosphate dehydrogenase (NAD(P)+)